MVYFFKPAITGAEMSFSLKENSVYFPYQKEFPIRVFEERQTGTPLHGHAFTEVVFVKDGTGLHLTPSGNYPLAKGDVFIIPAGGIHGYDKTEDLLLINLLFKSSYLPLTLVELYSNRIYRRLFVRNWDIDRDGDQYPLSRPKPEHFQELLLMLQLIIRNSLSEKNRSRCYELGMLMALLSRLCEWWADVAPEREKPPLDLSKIIAYCNKNFTDEIYLDDLARLSAMSRSTLLRHFSAAMGTTPMDYLLRLRIYHAAKLLANTSLTPKEVAEQSGFHDTSYFFRIFRKKNGMTPLQYRQSFSTEKSSKTARF